MPDSNRVARRTGRSPAQTATSYAPSHVPGTAAQYAFLLAMTLGAPRYTWRLLLHILTSRRVSETGSSTDETLAETERLEDGSDPGGDTGPFIPVPAKFIERHFRGASWQWLADAGLVEVRPYSRSGRRCREFRATIDVRCEFAGLGLTAQTLAAGGLVNLVTGRATTRRVKSVTWTPSGNALPVLVRTAMSAVMWALFCPSAIEVHIEMLRQAAEALPEGREKVSAQARYESDQRCYTAVLGQGAHVVAGDPEGQMRYYPAYMMQRTGRLGQIGGGLQSASRRMKTVAYSGVPGFKNFDLKASQAQILIVLLREAGINAQWLVDYARTGKEAAAAYVGIPVDDWKTALYAVLMGARIPPLAQARTSRGSVVAALQGAVAPDEFEPTYARFLDYTTGLRRALRTWHRWLDTDYLAANGRPNANGRTYITNGVGAVRAIEDLSGRGYERKAQLAAHLLQGREAAFTHALAASSSEFGFRVLSLEHDGLAVQGVIPTAAVERAAGIARLPIEMVDLVEKSFL